MGKLNAKRRNALPDSDFALQGRRFPIHDRNHARDALARATASTKLSDEQKAEIRRKVKAKYPNMQVAASQRFVLAASNLTSFATADAPAGLPTEIEGQPVAYREKEMIYCGQFFDEKTGKAFEITPARLDNWVNNFGRWTTAGNPVPLPAVDHFKGDEKLRGTSLGNLLKIERRGDKLYGLHQFIGADAISAAARNDSSVFVEAGKVDGKGNVYDEVLTHNLITPKPLIPGLQPFKSIPAVAASADPVSILTDKPPHRSIAMPLLEELRTALKLNADADEAAISAAFKTHMTSVAASLAKLDETKNALTASQTALAAAQPKVPDEYTLGLINESLDTKRQAAVTACSPAVIQEVDSIFIVDHKPTTLALSQVAGKTLLGRIYDVLAKVKGVPTGQQSKATLAPSLSMDSRPGQTTVAASQGTPQQQEQDEQLELLKKQTASYSTAAKK